jgi:hypothetical protein
MKRKNVVLQAGLFAVSAFASKVLGAQIARLRAFASAFEKAFAPATIPKPPSINFCGKYKIHK